MRQVHPRTDQHRARRHRQTKVAQDREDSESEPAARRVAREDDLGRQDWFVEGFRGRLDEVQIWSMTVSEMVR